MSASRMASRLVLAGALLVAGPGSVPAQGARDEERPPGDRADKTRYLERVPEREEQPPAELPDELSRALVDDLARRLGVASARIRVVAATEVVWSDGSLGCPRPGAVYTMATVDGFQVLLAHGEKEYDYRVASPGFFVLCTPSGPAPALRPGAAPPRGKRSPPKQ